MDCKTDLEKTSNFQTLSDIQKLLTDLNKSLIKLQKEKDDYEQKITECKGLCHEIRELMDATTTRIISQSTQS